MRIVWVLAVVVLVTLEPLIAAAQAIDDSRAAAAGIRKVPGERLTLYTDAEGAEVDGLPAVFEQAFPQWCKYFGVDQGRLADWHAVAMLMRDRARFEGAGLFPNDLPAFEPRGYTRDHRSWVYDQTTDFYRRELLLHEGTHAFMFTVLHGSGAPWYTEGMAEYLGTHRWKDGRLKLGCMPRSREESAGWGRIRMIQDAVAAHKGKRLRAVIEYGEDAFRENAPYAWCWAAVTLLDRHPRYQKRFRELVKFVCEHDFNERFYRAFHDDWQELCEEWQLMVTGLEFGYDVARSAVDFTPGKALSDEGMSVTVAAGRGWQSSGVRLEAGKRYRLTADGRYQVAKEPKTWWCEPGGVSIRYYRGRPLGILLAAVRPDAPKPDSISALVSPTVVGLGTTLAPEKGGTLFLKINDSAGELDDNAGELKVEVRPE